MAPLLFGSALAATLATTFDADAGDWTGGTLAGGALAVHDASATLAPGPLASFRLVARVRLVEGADLSFHAGDAVLAATYGEGGHLALGAETAPFPLAEHAWTADAAATFAGGAPDALQTGGRWLLYREVDGVVFAATSTDGVQWTDAGAVLDGATPTAVDEGGVVALYSTCDAGICRATAPDGLSFSEEGVVIAGGSDPAVAPRSSAEGGGWRMWYADGAGKATAISADGRTWTRETSLAAGRLDQLDVAALAGGTYGVWADAEGISASGDGVDGAFADASLDRGPILAAGAAWWCLGAPRAPSLVWDGTAWRLWIEGDTGVGHLRGVPSPGGWVGLVAEWDGATLRATWSGGPTLSAPLTAAGAMSFATDGALELDEVLVTYALAGEGDTGGAGDTGDTADTGGTGDTGGAADTGGAGDTSDTSDTSEPPDTSAPVVDTAPTFNAAELSGETGGCGCATASGPATLVPFALLALLAAPRRGGPASPPPPPPRAPLTPGSGAPPGRAA